ncbi:MAG: DNA-binding transcriptional MocR family regulator [Afipia broomeae]|jgi:DNA-binding transcriptional MocR family regulator|nr:MAG: PLP-dependent aminotransferase family protein [Bradyrhizobiaceae bacterium]
MGTVQSNSGATRSRIETIANEIVARIERGVLRPGERLPSIRGASELFGASKNTIVDAYERLVASGQIESKPGSGFYVSLHRPKRAETAEPAKVEAVDSVWLLREQLEKRYEVRVGDGRPPAAWMEGSEVGPYLRPVSRPGQRNLPESYGSPYGLLPLRQRIAGLLAERSIGAEPTQVLLTQGANDALDMIVRQYVEPGDPVLVDSPGYYPLFGKLRLAKARLIGVRRTVDGPDPDDLAAKAASTGARMFFTQSLAHNPTGCSITLPVAYRLLRTATDHNLRVVDSDPFADVLSNNSPRLAALDQLDRVIYVGTFAKTLSASLRSGYIAANADTVARLADLKMITRANSSGYIEQIIYDLITSGRYRGHLKRLNGRIEAATRQANDSLARLGLPVFGQPRGGFYMWCELPAHIDDTQLSRVAAERSILLAPGSAFNPDATPATPAMRVNIAHVGDPRFESFMAEHRNP